MVDTWSPTTGPAGLAEWQTRRTQNALSERTCGFDPHSRYEKREERRTRWVRRSSRSWWA